MYMRDLTVVNLHVTWAIQHHLRSFYNSASNYDNIIGAANDRTNELGEAQPQTNGHGNSTWNNGDISCGLVMLSKGSSQNHVGMQYFFLNNITRFICRTFLTPQIPHDTGMWY